MDKSINLKDLFAKMQEPDFAIEFEKYLQKDNKKQEERYRRASSKEYIDWLYGAVSKNGILYNECLFPYQMEDPQNGNLLTYFIDYIEQLADTQGVSVTTDTDCPFDNENVTVKIKDRYFSLFRMHELGLSTTIKLLDKEPDHAYIILEDEGVLP
jgi:hypothetical protein